MFRYIFPCFIRLFVRIILSLQRDDTLYPTPSPVAMAQERFCLCADFLQQSFAGDGLFHTDAFRIHVVLPDIEQYLLFQ